MKRIKALNGYTIMKATERDEARYNVTAGRYYIYFSSDLRDYGLSNSDPDWEEDSLEIALEWCTSNNYATAKEIVEAITTAATFEEIAHIEKLLDAGIPAEEIDAIEAVSVIEECGLFYVHIESRFEEEDHGPYFTRYAAEQAADNYKKHQEENTL